MCTYMFFFFRNKVPPRPAGQRTEPDANAVNNQLIKLFFG